MSSLTTDDNTNSTCQVYKQKQQVALYNSPLIRLQMNPSPYPSFTQFQLDMRRKTEILKYSSNQQNTKTNNFTKKQLYANLALNRNRTSTLQNTDTNLVCNGDATKITSTTACDIPGPPINIYYDPSVPLYNYGNLENNRPYAILNEVIDTTFNFYTKNIINYIQQYTYDFTPDISLSYQTFVSPLGSLIIGKNLQTTNYSFSLSVPISIWVSGCINSGYDENNVLLKKPTITTTDVMTIQIQNIKLNVLFNGNKIIMPNYTINSSSLINCVFHLSSLEKQFYGIQYIGMLHINNLTLQTPKDTIYDLTVEFDYTYDNSLAYKMDYFQTGMYANIADPTNPNYLYRCSFDSITPLDFTNGVFTHYNF
jgi:hypothetical protein